MLVPLEKPTRDIHFANQVKAAPVIQILNSLKTNFEIIDRNKNSLIKYQNHDGAAMELLEAIDDDMDDLIRKAKKIQDEIKRAM